MFIFEWLFVSWFTLANWVLIRDCLRSTRQEACLRGALHTYRFLTAKRYRLFVDGLFRGGLIALCLVMEWGWALAAFVTFTCIQIAIITTALQRYPLRN